MGRPHHARGALVAGRPPQSRRGLIPKPSLVILQLCLAGMLPQWECRSSCNSIWASKCGARPSAGADIWHERQRGAGGRLGGAVGAAAAVPGRAAGAGCRRRRAGLAARPPGGAAWKSAPARSEFQSNSVVWRRSEKHLHQALALLLCMCTALHLSWSQGQERPQMLGMPASCRRAGRRCRGWRRRCGWRACGR